MPTLPEQISTQLLIWAVALFIIKHLLADFILQTGWMARGKERTEGWLAPLLAHITVHAIGTLLIAFAIAPQLAWLAVVDFVVHGLIDKSKTLIQQRHRFRIEQAAYWWLFGTDQTLHHLTHLAFAVLIAAAATGI
jgi:hydrogenase-4 membrane subunit HyfE